MCIGYFHPGSLPQPLAVVSASEGFVNKAVVVDPLIVWHDTSLSVEQGEVSGERPVLPLRDRLF
jgi:hypothetical protein